MLFTKCCKGSSGTGSTKGEKGDAGSPGSAGPKGTPGQKGVMGDKGNTGNTGSPGSTRPTGRKGAPGQKGMKGNKGEINGGTVYVRWGHNKSPSTAQLVYSGRVEGSHHTHSGSGSNPQCLPLDPNFLKSVSGNQRALMYGQS